MRGPVHRAPRGQRRAGAGGREYGQRARKSLLNLQRQGISHDVYDPVLKDRTSEDKPKGLLKLKATLSDNDGRMPRELTSIGKMARHTASPSQAPSNTRRQVDRHNASLHPQKALDEVLKRGEAEALAEQLTKHDVGGSRLIRCAIQRSAPTDISRPAVVSEVRPNPRSGRAGLNARPPRCCRYH